MMTKTNMDVIKQGRPKQDLIRHKLKCIRGSFQERNLPEILRKDWICNIRKNYVVSFSKKEVIKKEVKKLLRSYIKNLREGAKNWVFTKSKGLCVQSSELISKSKHYRYLETPLLNTYMKYIIAKKTMWWSSRPKGKPKYAQNWDQKHYVMGYVMGHN